MTPCPKAAPGYAVMILALIQASARPWLFAAYCQVNLPAPVAASWHAIPPQRTPADTARCSRRKPLGGPAGTVVELAIKRGMKGRRFRAGDNGLRAACRSQNGRQVFDSEGQPRCHQSPRLPAGTAQRSSSSVRSFSATTDIPSPMRWEAVVALREVSNNERELFGWLDALAAERAARPIEQYCAQPAGWYSTGDAGAFTNGETKTHERSCRYAQTHIAARDADGVATVTLNRRASSTPCRKPWRSLARQLEGIAADKSVRVVVLAGAGKAFCAGHDPEGDARTIYQGQQALFRLCGKVMMQIVGTMPQPVIARIHGIATAADLPTGVDVRSGGGVPRWLWFAVSGINIGLFCATPGVSLYNMGRKRAFRDAGHRRFIGAARLSVAVW